jgi:hypothetical protein
MEGSDTVASGPQRLYFLVLALLCALSAVLVFYR